ncbi:hypothetical protein ACGFZK_09485 [Streptomyces sp. NPDC048257]|uniref:hypothetical protein n=1 Tax=Streptomyces sp. NPDC048257 TaxID=3365526 RepID=UPI00371A36DB
MPGRNVVALTSLQETSAVGAAVADLARLLTLQRMDAMTPARANDPSQARTQALALLLVLDQVRLAAERLQHDAAADAARAGAGYPQLGDTCGITRQGARRRWPGLSTPPTTTSRSIL